MVVINPRVDDGDDDARLTHLSPGRRQSDPVEAPEEVLRVILVIRDDTAPGRGAAAATAPVVFDLASRFSRGR